MPPSPDAPFAEFSPVFRDAWEARVAADLRGRPAESLDWDTGAGFALRPFYLADDLDDLPHLAPDARPLHRDVRRDPAWRLREALTPSAPSEARRAASQAAEHGADVIEVALAEPGLLTDIRQDAPDAELLFVLPPDTNGLDALADLGAEALRDARLFTDPYAAGIPAPGHLATLYERVGGHSPDAAWLTADLRPYARRGADPVLETALALALLTQQIDEVTESGARPTDVLGRLQVIVPIESRVMLSIAKLRALRLVVGRLAEAFGVPAAPPVVLHAETGTWDATRYAPYTNLVRATVKAAAAVLGGCDTLRVRAHDDVGDGGTPEGRRLARNIGLLLRHEAWLGAPGDPGGGAYYVEVATDHIARGAWERFRAFEANGGFRAVMEDGALGQLLAARANAAQHDVATRRHVLVGTNLYAHVEPAPVVLPVPETAAPPRAAEPFEAMRARTEGHAHRTGRRPLARLVLAGDPKLRAARAAFARGVLACAGFALDQPASFDAPEALDRHVFDGAPDLVVLCSADDAYPALVQRAAALRADAEADALLLVAGRPVDSVEALRRAGVEDFLYLGMDVLAALTRLQDRLGLAA